MRGVVEVHKETGSRFMDFFCWYIEVRGSVIVKKQRMLNMAVSREGTETFPIAPVHTHTHTHTYHNAHSVYLLYFFATSNSLEHVKLKISFH
jgi:hypothetical protein